MNVFAAAARAWRNGQSAALATTIGVAGSAPRHSGARMLILDDGDTVGTIGGGALEHAVIVAAADVIRTGRPLRFEAHTVRDLGMCCGGRVEVYVEALQSKLPIVVFGAGHVAHAVVPVLRALDYDITVVDDRTELCTVERFPHCERHTGDPRAYAEALQGHADLHVLVVTHDHALDQDLVEALLLRDTAWIGMIGSRGKVARFLVRYRAAGVSKDALQKLRAPVGLDIGAETPAEIAIAIAGELIRLRRRVERAPIPLSEIPLKARNRF